MYAKNNVNDSQERKKYLIIVYFINEQSYSFNIALKKINVLRPENYKPLYICTRHFCTFLIPCIIFCSSEYPYCITSPRKSK